MANILVVGSINMDIVAAAPRPARPGETLAVDAVRLAPGGKGANAAVAAARLGGHVRMIGAVGDDAFADALMGGLRDNGVDTRWVARRPGASGAALIAVDAGTGQNTILFGPGANAFAALPDSDEPFRWADMVVMPLEIPLSLVLETARRARAASKPLLLDPAPVPADLPDELWPLCAIVSPNETELALLAPRPGLDRLEPEAYASGIASEVARAVAALRGKGARTVVAKLGRHGAYWEEEDYQTFGRPRPIRSVDATAAGDAFTGALAVALAEGRGREEALARALAAGTLACTRAGAQPSLPRREEVDRWLEKTG